MQATLLLCDKDDSDFIRLTEELDKELHKMYGADQARYDALNALDGIENAVVAYLDQAPVGCGGFKEYAPGVAELKRVFVQPGCRRRGISRQIVQMLHFMAKSLGYRKMILSTGNLQQDAMALYESMGYHPIDGYGEYRGDKIARCYEIELSEEKEC